MFIDTTLRRNPSLVEATVELHRGGKIPSNCYVIDLDTVSRNAATVAAAARSHGLTAYQMTKQFGRNPVVARAIADAGIDRVVAVDFEEARLLHRHGLKMGHVGHLVQVPAAEVPLAVDMHSDFMTVFGYTQAERISTASVAAGRVQDITLRVAHPEDTFYAAQRGGVASDNAVAVAKQIDALPGLRFRGVTSFPVVLWSEEEQAFRPTRNLTTLAEVSAAIRAAGIDSPVLNAPSACCSATFGMKAAAGATHVEPGSCLTGQTPLHAVSDEPELPAMVYVSEVTHTQGETVFSLGGGFYPRSKARRALIYPRHRDEPVWARVELDPAEAIDYYGNLYVDDIDSVEVGDTVVYAFRAQVFVSRCFVAVLSDVATNPTVVGVFDRSGFELGENLLPTGGGVGA